MEKKAEAYAKYNKAAVAEMMIKVLPDVAAKIAEPLGQIDKITIIGGDGGNNGVEQVAGNVPAVMAKLFESMKEATGIAQIAMHDPEVGDEVLSNVYVANADAAKVQRITTSSANDNNRISDRFVEDASYLRIKNISLGYTFPQKWLRRLQIDHLRLYVNIQNLCTITGYKGYDPEIGALNYNVLLRGVDDARYPSQRIYTFGLNFNF